MLCIIKAILTYPYISIAYRYNHKLPDLVIKVPPEIVVPEFVAEKPTLPFPKRWTKRFERISIETKNLFNRAGRSAKLAEFDEKWSAVECAVLARRLASFDIAKQYGAVTALGVRSVERRLNWNDPGFPVGEGLFMPKAMTKRAEVYQVYIRYRDIQNDYRSKLGLPPTPGPEGSQMGNPSR